MNEEAAAERSRLLAADRDAYERRTTEDLRRIQEQKYTAIREAEKKALAASLEAEQQFWREQGRVDIAK